MSLFHAMSCFLLIISHNFQSSVHVHDFKRVPIHHTALLANYFGTGANLFCHFLTVLDGYLATNI